jgi:indolepyruvate ferredoxin oxidoreductase, beta subunit
MNGNRPVCVLVAALGGQGGGVLADWLVAAARFDGLEAQATSIPGVAQRTGATTYYFEVVPRRDLPGRPVFSIYPATGAVDLVVSLEPMEAARALVGGFVGQETTVITARERIFSTAEKIRPGDGTVSIAPILAALQRCAGTMRAIDLGRAARGAKCHPNAMMFGVMAASGVLPMGPESCRQAIAGAGVAVVDNLKGFEAGLILPAEPASAGDEPAAVFAPAPEFFADAIAALPDAVRLMAGHAAARLLDYQDAAYVRRYLDRLGRIVEVDGASQNYRLSALVARRLAAWMAFEDVIRVAELKTRPGRLARIRAEIGVDDDVPVAVHDFLKPGRDELDGMLPASLGKWLPARRASRHGTGFAVHLKTSGPFGWLALRSLAALKSWRPRTARFQREQDMIERWLQSVTVAAVADYALACDTADLAVWARGYGDVRYRGLARLKRIFTDWPRRIAADREALGDAVRASLAAAYSDPDAEVTP